VTIDPVQEIRDLPAVPTPDPSAGLILTSENAVAAAAVLAPGRRAWCVGPRTALVAKQAGLLVHHSDGGDAAALVAALLASDDRGPLVHLRGAEARGDIAARLTEAGVSCVELVVYEQVTRKLGDPARDLLARPGPVLVPLFSPRSAARLAREITELGPIRARLRPVAISAAAAEAWTGPDRGVVPLAARPDAQAMIGALLAAARAP
jgi:uroporphyrinogen-III synthase